MITQKSWTSSAEFSVLLHSGACCLSLRAIKILKFAVKQQYKNDSLSMMLTATDKNCKNYIKKSDIT